MRIDKLTTAFQQALQDAQSAAVARDNPYIEPAHLLAAMLQQADGPRSLLERAGAKVSALDTAMETAIRNLPTVQGGGQPVQPGRDLMQLLQAADKEALKLSLIHIYVARMMGLPIGQLVLATNENDVLDEFFRTGTYRVRTTAETHETSSPSMDISKASNFERFVFDLLGRDGARTAELFGATLAQAGGFTLDAAELAPATRQGPGGFGFVSGCSTHADRLATIGQTWRQSGVLIDTHTADGLKVARAHLRPGVPMLVLETALPAKFAKTIREATGQDPQPPAALRGIEKLPRRFTLMKPDVAAVKAYIHRHCSA